MNSRLIIVVAFAGFSFGFFSKLAYTFLALATGGN